MKEEFNIVICDDEAEFLKRIEVQVREIMCKNDCQCNIKGFTQGRDLIKYCKKNAADILLADIDIPDINGFKVVEELRKQQQELAVVFVSVHEELAYQSFIYNPFQFVSKVDLGRLESVMEDVIRKIRRRTESKNIIHLSMGHVIEINLNEIMYLKSDGNYISAYNAKEPVLKFRGGLKNVYQELSSEGFINVHRSYIINCRFIHRFGRTKVTLINGKQINTTRNSDIINEAQKVYAKFMREARW